MFTKNNIISTIVTGLWAFFGGYFLWGILGESLMEGQEGSAIGVGREMPDFLHLAIGCLILALAFSTIYKKWGAGNYGVSNGIQFGALVGLLQGFGSGIIDFATSNMLTIQGALINGAIYFVFFIIMGLLAGLIFKKVA